MVNGPHIHDPSGHRYGKGDLPIADTIGKIKSAVIAGRDKKRKDIEKKNKDANKPQEETPSEEVKKKPVQITVGGTLPFRRGGELPPPVKQGEGGKFKSNPAYGERKQADTDFNAGIAEQKILQNHSAAQFDEHRVDIAGDQSVKVPGKRMRATGYGPTDPRTGKTNKARMGTIQKTAQRIEAIRAQNAALRTPHETPATKPASAPSAPSNGPGKPPSTVPPSIAAAEKAGLLNR